MGKHSPIAHTKRIVRKLNNNCYETDDKGYEDLQCVSLEEEDSEEDSDDDE